MPNSGALWMAAGLLWILDTSGNIAMEPFRAFVADKLPDSQRTKGFAMQSFYDRSWWKYCISIAMDYVECFHVSRTVGKTEIFQHQ